MTEKPTDDNKRVTTRACRAVHVARGGGECWLLAGHPGPHSWVSGQGREDAWRSPAAWRSLLDAAESERNELRALCREAAVWLGEQPGTEAGHALYLRLRAAGESGER